MVAIFRTSSWLGMTVLSIAGGLAACSADSADPAAYGGGAGSDAGSDAEAGGAGTAGTGGSGGTGGTAGTSGSGGGTSGTGGGSSGTGGADASPPDAAPDAAPDSITVDGACGPVTAVADVDPWAMRLPSAGFGGIQTASSGGHTDVFLASPTNYVRVGVRLDWGGTVVFYGLAADPGSNVIDANDTGRELQIALYDPSRSNQPCAATATCQSAPASCGNSITFLGWNPVQGGDECNHGATVLSHGQVGDALEIVVRPLQWNPDWNKPDCTQSSCGPNGLPVDVLYRMQFRFVTEHVVEVATEVVSEETFDHPITGQEWPTLYVSHGQGGPDLPVLLDASGQTVALNTLGNDGFYYDNFTSPEPWVSWQNAASNYGVGLAMDQGTKAFQGWRGDGSTAPYFHNVRAQVAFGIGAGSVIRGISYLALGGFGTVQSELRGVLDARAPFGSVDEPAGGAPVSYSPGQEITVRGWTLDTEGGNTVHVEIDGNNVATIPIQGSRPDVCAVYPAYAECPNVGYQGQVSTAGLDVCAHLLRVVATDADGNARVLGERAIVPQ